MVRRWYIPLATLAVAAGSVFAVGGVASASVPGAVSTVGPAAGVHAFIPGGRMIRSGTAATHAAHGRFTTAYSTNWSGYAVTGSNGQFTSVSASWTQPAANCSGNKKRTNQYAAFWVGLDGYNSSSVEQTGTDSDCVGSSPSYYGWYEMYPAYPVYFTNPVKPGDKLSASVTFSGSSTYTLVLKDSTQGWTQTITANQTGLARSSAEVITEAPSSSSGVLPLADFGTISYTGATGNGSSMGTQSPVQIIMVNNRGQAKDSTSSITSTGDFSNTWLRSK